MNLAANARDAMPQGGTLRVSTSSREVPPGEDGGGFRIMPGRYAVMTIADTGEGIDPAARERIFDPFFTTRAEGKGTGLGLSIVYAIVKQASGYIWVESEPGRGTVFTLYLPTTAEAAGGAPTG